MQNASFSPLALDAPQHDMFLDLIITFILGYMYRSGASHLFDRPSHPQILYIDQDK